MVEFMGEAFVLGDKIRGKRIAARYKNLTDFSEAIDKATGYTITKDQLQRIESGRQQPTVFQYMAIALTLGTLQDPMLIEAVPQRMKDYVTNSRISEYLDKHPDSRIASSKYSEDGTVKIFTMNDGKQVEVGLLGKQIWEHDSTAEIVGYGWEAF